MKRNLIPVLLWAASGLWAAEPSVFNIAYAGRLLGYARTPDIQRFRYVKEHRGVPVYQLAAGSGMNETAKEIVQQLTSIRAQGPTLTLGMGDSLVLDYFSRVAVLEKNGESRYAPKDELVHWDEARGWVYLRDTKDAGFRDLPQSKEYVVDNSAMFFAEAGYDALVPGKHDFYLGPEWLRKTAFWFGENRVAMLGANLLIRTIAIRTPEAKPEFLRKRDYARSSSEIRLSPPGVALPWIRQFQVGSKAVTAELCGPLADPDPDMKPKDCLGLSIDSAGELTARARIAQGAKPLAVGAYLLCVQSKEPGSKPVCQPFRVEQPFFDKPYVKTKSGAVVMGVVAQAVEQQIGLLNRTWLHETDRNIEFSATAADPVKPLEQAIDYCTDMGDCLSGTPMILMAQMGHDAARLLNHRLRRRFAVVLAQSDDRFATSDAATEYHVGHDPVVLVPRPFFRGSFQSLQVGVQVAAVAAGKLTTVTHRIAEVPLRHGGAIDCGSDPVNRAWKKAYGNEPADAGQKFEALVLRALRSRLSADIAILQRRDFFAASKQLTACPQDPVRAEALRSAIDRILWKGDFAVARTIKGSALKAALDHSREFERTEADPYSSDPESGRGLVYQGLFFDSDSQSWFVNGAALENDVLYRVTVSDFLAFGDTGYPQFLVDGEEHARSIRLLPRIADLALQEIAPKEPKPKPLLFTDYLDYGGFPRPAPPKSATVSDRLRKFMHAYLEKSQGYSGGKPEEDAQFRSYWRFLLDKTEIGFDDYTHNRGTQDALSKAFKGTPESSVLSRKSTTVGTAVQFEARRESRRRQFFVRTEQEYQRLSLQQDGPAGDFLATYPQNRISIESGFRGVFRGTIRRRRQWGWVASSQVTTQIHNPVETFALKDASVVASINRTTRFLAKAGVRRESREGWFEGGLFAGAVRRPGLFTVRNGDRTTGNCWLAQLSGSVADCLKTIEASPSPAVSTSPATGPVSGAFLNFDARYPLPKGILRGQAVFENRGRIFFNHSRDTLFDARYIDSLSAAVAIPIVRNLSLKPKLSLFLYENKRLGRSMRGLTYDMHLEYRFDRHSGVPWGAALLGGSRR
ncbi:MAG: hypothetical protein U0Q16_20520 [Bryobacteraceae bacterium]